MINKKQITISLILLIVIYIIYKIATFDYIEFKRANIVSAQKEITETLSWSIAEKKSELNSLLEEYIIASECIKLNSKTWSIVNCNNIKEIIKIDKIIEDSRQEVRQPLVDKEATYWIKLDKVICEVGQINWNKSPLCGNIELQKKLKSISDKKWVDFKLLLGITYAESHLWANYAKGCDSSFHNLWGIKWRKLDNGQSIRDQGLPTAEGCYLYKFKSYEDYWVSFSNSIKYWYITKGCSDIECISKWWVKWDWLYKPAYNNRVNVFKF
jgi:predicted RNA binding protein with dsRBD fold (UPF0201 family)